MANKHNMDPNKSGVIIFFEPMLEEVDDLDDARLGQLYRATLHFAAGGGDPVFEDETLRHIWRFVRALIIRDDKNYTKKVAGKQYGVYCRFAKEHHYTPLSREDWDELGGPTFKEWEKTLKSQTHTNVCDVCVCMPTSDSPSHSDSLSSSTAESVSESSAQQREAAETPERVTVLPFSSPALHNAYIRWIMHWEEVTKRNLPESSRNALAEEFQGYAKKYGLEAVDALITEAVSSAYKSIPWDRLERRREQAASASGMGGASGANGGKGGPDAMDALRELHEKFLREDGQ